MIYYPVPLYKQEAFQPFARGIDYLEHTETLCKEVISLPIHTEMTDEQLEHIITIVQQFFD